ncbi:unnamed protein product [Dracunculus medinensis]|uniref:DUF4767 domain-containing protein n=1 Tax=Dracunculus medinensis TaxID=318479 RepID=A0A0N4UL78_DRAME|nr:unnamed protein product [Dracunculus medinensis]
MGFDGSANDYPKRIYSDTNRVSNAHLAACPKWNCIVESGKALQHKLHEYDAILISFRNDGFNYEYKSRPNQYVVFFDHTAKDDAQATSFGNLFQ